MLLHVNQQPLAADLALRVQVEGPDLLHRGVRIGQVHHPAVGAEGQAIACAQALDRRGREATPGVSKQRTGIRGRRHVAHHAADPKPAFAVGSTVVEAHIGQRELHRLKLLLGQHAVGLQHQLEQPGLHSRQQAATGVHRDAADAFGHGPLMMAALDVHLVHRTAFNVDPVQGLFSSVPDRALAHLATGLAQDAGLGCGHHGSLRR